MEKNECIIHGEFPKNTDVHLVIYYHKDEKNKKITITKIYRRHDNLEIDTTNMVNNKLLFKNAADAVKKMEKNYDVF